MVNLIQETIANTKWDIVKTDEDVEMTPELEEQKKRITEFLRNPNGNKESFATIVKSVVKDILEIDSGVWIKVFNRMNEMVQIFTRDGATFLKNPDIFGYMGNREKIIFPINSITGGSPTDPFVLNMYDHFYRNQAAYFQYGFFVQSMPIPYGRDEVVYFMKNPRPDSIYGLSAVAILADIIYTLVYGSQYNLDFYTNNNMPEGILSMLDAKQKEITAFRSRFEPQFKKIDQLTGFEKRVGYKIPIVNTKTEFIPFQLSAREMEIISQQEWFTKIVWAAFGISADDMGFTEDSNKAVSDSQSKKFAKKAAVPILNLIAERINMEIIPEFNVTDLKFEYDDYDLDEDIKRHALYESQIRMGIKTPEMVAEEENIDVTELTRLKDENADKEMARAQATNGFNGFDDPKNKKGNLDHKEKKNKKQNIKSKLGGELEKELKLQITQKASQITKALDSIDSGALSNVQ